MIFIDTGAFVAQHYVPDPFHAAALRGWRRIEESKEAIFTTSHCVAEAITVLGRASRDFDWATGVGQLILSSRLLEIHCPDRAELSRAAAKMRALAPHRVGFVDALSLSVMEARRVNMAFTFDREDFVKAGKMKLWEPIPRLKT